MRIILALCAVDELKEEFGGRCKSAHTRLKKAAGSISGGPPGSKSITYELFLAPVFKTCTGEPRARIKSPVPSKEQKHCCGADTSPGQRLNSPSPSELPVCELTYSRIHAFPLAGDRRNYLLRIPNRSFALGIGTSRRIPLSRKRSLTISPSHRPATNFFIEHAADEGGRAELLQKFAHAAGHPALIACVIRRVDKHAVHFASVDRQQRFERMQIVAVNDEVAVKRDGANALFRVRLQRPKWHGQVVIVDKLLALEIQLTHVAPVPKNIGFADA